MEVKAKDIIDKLKKGFFSFFKDPQEYIYEAINNLRKGGEIKGIGWIFELVATVLLCFIGFKQKSIGQKSKVLTYHTVFSLIPVFAFIIAIAKGFGGYDEKIIDLINEYVGENSDKVMQLYYTAQKQLEYSQGGVILGVGIIFLTWSVYSIFSEVESFFNDIWRITTSRSFIRRVSNYIASLFIITILMICSVGFRVYTNEIGGAIGTIVKWGTPWIATFLMFFFLYTAIPNTRVKASKAIISAFIASLAFIVLYFVFTTIMFKAASYNQVYGSIAIIVLGLMFMNYFWVITLSGAELCFSMQSDGNLNFISTGDKKKSDYENDFYRLRIASYIYRRFSEAKDGNNSFSDVKTLSEECSLSSHQVMDYLEKLRVAGIVSQVQIETREDCFQPAMPVEQMTMRLFFNKIHTADFNKEDETQTQSEISKHFCNHISNIENATSEMLIKDL